MTITSRDIPSKGNNADMAAVRQAKETMYKLSARNNRAIRRNLTPATLARYQAELDNATWIYCLVSKATGLEYTSQKGVKP